MALGDVPSSLGALCGAPTLPPPPGVPPYGAVRSKLALARLQPGYSFCLGIDLVLLPICFSFASALLPNLALAQLWLSIGFSIGFRIGFSIGFSIGFRFGFSLASYVVQL